MKMSGMLTRSSMACSLRPSRCRSKASPRMACRRRCGQGQGATALPRSLWQQQLSFSGPWDLQDQSTRAGEPSLHRRGD